MKNPKKYKSRSKESQVKEPAVNYDRVEEKELMFFNSFSEMNEYDIKVMADLTADERFRNITCLLQHLYAKELARNVKPRELHFN